MISTTFNYFILFLSFFLIYITYLLLKESPFKFLIRRGRDITIFILLIFAIVLSTFGMYSEILKNSDLKRIEHLGKSAQDAYIDGGKKGDHITGTWRASYYSIKDSIILSSNIYLSDEVYKSEILTTYFERFPDEKIEIVSDKSLLFAKSGGTFDGTEKEFKLWGEGRFSSGDDITFTYWSPIKNGVDQFVGVNFLYYKKSQNLDGYEELKGYWIGRTHKGNIRQGVTIWKRL